MKTLLVIPAVLLLGACASEPSRFDKQRAAIQKEEARELIDSVDLEAGESIEIKERRFGNERIDIQRK
jgi:starvation-inducible outer membrane lipoprotein